MMKTSLLFYLLVPIAIFGEIFEVNSFEQIVVPNEKNLLVILDIDNTLIRLKQDLGSDQWFYHRLDELKNGGRSSNEALSRVAAEFNGIQSLSQSQPVEECIPKFIESLRLKGIPFMGLTIRSFELSKRTHQQLNDCGIRLQTDVFDRKPQFLDPDTFLFSFDGAVFTNGGNKGIAFLKWLDFFSQKWEHIVVVDDKLAHLEALEKAAQIAKIKFTGFRYGHLDGLVKEFCPNRTQLQYGFIKMRGCIQLKKMNCLRD